MNIINILGLAVGVLIGEVIEYVVKKIRNK